jgi:hypothetical protein
MEDGRLSPSRGETREVMGLHAMIAASFVRIGVGVCAEYREERRRKLLLAMLQSGTFPLLTDLGIFLSPGQVALYEVSPERLLFKLSQLVTNGRAHESTPATFANASLQHGNGILGNRKVDPHSFHD